jgi:hypothetical protein
MSDPKLIKDEISSSSMQEKSYTIFSGICTCGAWEHDVKEIKRIYNKCISLIMVD